MLTPPMGLDIPLGTRGNGTVLHTICGAEAKSRGITSGMKIVEIDGTNVAKHSAEEIIDICQDLPKEPIEVVFAIHKGKWWKKMRPKPETKLVTLIPPYGLEFPYTSAETCHVLTCNPKALAAGVEPGMKLLTIEQKGAEKFVDDLNGNELVKLLSKLDKKSQTTLKFATFPQF